MVTVEFEFERPTKSKVRFFNEEWGTIYVPNRVFDELGRPERITVALEAVTSAAALAAVK